MMNLKFRVLVIMLAVCFILVAAAGCGTQAKVETKSEKTQEVTKQEAQQETKQQEPAKEEKKKEAVTLTFVKSNDSTLNGMEEIFKNFEAKTGNKVEIQSLPGGNDFETVVKTRFATKDFPDIMLYFPGTAQYDSLRAADNLLDLAAEPYIADMTDAAKNFQTMDGKIYGLPWGSFSSMGVIYNKDVFGKVGVSIPKNYADFLSICERIKAAGIIPIQEAGKDAWPVQVFSLAGWETFVDPVIGKEGIAKLNKNEMKLSEIPQIKDMFTRQVELKKKGYLNKNLLSATYDMQQEAIAKGAAAMIIQGEWILPDIKKKFGDDTVNKLGMFPIPSDNDAGIAALYPPAQILIPKAGKNVETAKELARFITQKDSLEIWYKNNPGIPVYKTVETKLMAPQEDMFKFAKEGKAEINIQSRLRPQFLEYDKITQTLIMSGNVDEAVKKFDENYRKDGKNKQFPGF